MTSFIALNLVVFICLVFTTLEQRLLPDISSVGTIVKKKLSPLFLISFVAIAFVAELFLILNANATVLTWYLTGTFSLLILLHARLLSEGKSLLTKVMLVSCALILVALRLLYPYSEFIHIVFILSAIVWIGPLLTQIKLITTKRFIVISIIWFLYDIFFVWLSNTATSVNEKTQAINFVLGIELNRNIIGAGDMLWINLFISTLTNKRLQITAAAILVAANILYGWYDYTKGFTMFFPLLVLWVPIGLSIYFLLDRNLSRKE